MRHLNTRDSLTSLLCVVAISVVSWIGGCAGVPEKNTWIVVGTTTRDEVVKRYGQPDITQISGDGSVDTYWPASEHSIHPHIEIPTVQVAPLGNTTTQMKLIEPGLGRPITRERLPQEIRIRYDEQGIVQEVMP